MHKNPRFLKDKYGLQNSPEVERAARRTEARTGQKLSLQSAEGADARIQNYLDRFNEILTRKDPEQRKQGIQVFKDALYDKFVIKPEDVPEAYFDSIKRKHREEGHGDIEIPKDYRDELSATVVADQKKSLNTWIDYLSSNDATSPDWLKYYALRSILRMGRYDKKKKSFTERTGKAIAPFPDLNRAALAIVLDSVEGQLVGRQPKFGYDIQPDAKAQFLQSLDKANFSKLYAVAVEEFKPIAEELLKITKGKWILYPRGSDPLPLVQSISNHGTGWCLRGEATAERYLVRDQNDLHVYYSFDKEGKPTVPRVVMVINRTNKISEVRGVAPEEELDPYIGDVVKEKLAEFPDAESFLKKLSDMKALTEVDRKAKAGEALKKEDLIFLYEINSKIEGFGYGKDPRIAQLKKGRDEIADICFIFDCKPEEIVRFATQITNDTKILMQNHDEQGFTYRIPTTAEREFGARYQKMKEIEDKLRENPEWTNDPLSHEELLFLYGFGVVELQSYPNYLKDELADMRKKSGREVFSDIGKIFHYTPDQIARSADELSESTKLFLGQFEPGIFDRFPKEIEHIYTEFPGEPILFKTLQLKGRKGFEKLYKQVVAKESQEVFDEYTRHTENLYDAMRSHVDSKEQDISLVIMSRKSLPGWDRIAEKRKSVASDMQNLGLKEVPFEVAPRLFLEYPAPHSTLTAVVNWSVDTNQGAFGSGARGTRVETVKNFGGQEDRSFMDRDKILVFARPTLRDRIP